MISTNEPGKKGHQSVVVLSKERKEKEEKVNPIAVKMSDDYDRTETFPSKVESRLNEEGPSEMGREPYPESLPSRFEGNN